MTNKETTKGFSFKITSFLLIEIILLIAIVTGLTMLKAGQEMQMKQCYDIGMKGAQDGNVCETCSTLQAYKAAKTFYGYDQDEIAQSIKEALEEKT